MWSIGWAGAIDIERVDIDYYSMSMAGVLGSVRPVFRTYLLLRIYWMSVCIYIYMHTYRDICVFIDIHLYL